MALCDEQVKIQDILFYIPKKEDIKKWDYKEWKEGKTKYKSIWLDEYLIENNAYCLNAHCLVSINGSKFLMDDRKLKGDDIDNAKKLFKGIE
jgi:hypothetical protein